MAVTLQPKTNTEKIMNKTRTLLLAILLIGICCGISAKTLVVYYSYTNNVRTIVNDWTMLRITMLSVHSC